MSGRDGEQGDLWFRGPGLGRLTGGAPLDVTLYEIPESRPPVPV